MMNRSTGKNEASRPDELDRLVRSWRERENEENEVLSASARVRILGAVRGSSPRAGAPLGAALFLPTSRWAWAAVAPAVALTLALTWLVAPSGPIPADPLSATPPVSAAKVDGDVVFVIANGGKPHNVYRSTNPGAFDRAPAAVTRDGSFRDRLHGGPDLVFYRID